MNAAPFYLFAGILGLVVGAVVVWLLMAEHPFEALETPGGPVDDVEAGLLAEELQRDGVQMDEAAVKRLLELHGAYVEGKIKDAQAAADAVRVEASRRGRARTWSEADPNGEPAPDSAEMTEAGPEPPTDQPAS
jgi:hypothetical protein